MSNGFKKVLSHFGDKLAYRLNTSFANPKLVYLKITSKCNFRCEHCDIWQTQNKPDLSLAEWKTIIRKIKTAIPNLTVTISGGEPLLYQDFWQLIEFLKEEKVLVNLNTNGSLITDEIIGKLLEYPFNKIEVSLYSLKSEIHDHFRNSVGAFLKANMALEKLAQQKKKQASNTEIVIAFLLNQKNIDEAPEFIKHFSPKGIAVSIQALDTNIQEMDKRTCFENKTEIQNNDLWPTDKEKVKTIFAQLMKLKDGGYLIYNRKDALDTIKEYYLSNFSQIKKLPCYVGQNNLIVSCEGNAFFCFSGPSIGNLLNDSWKTIWQGAEAQKIRRSIKKCTELCRVMNCNFQSSLFQKIIEKLRKIN